MKIEDERMVLTGPLWTILLLVLPGFDMKRSRPADVLLRNILSWETTAIRPIPVNKDPSQVPIEADMLTESLKSSGAIPCTFEVIRS